MVYILKDRSFRILKKPSALYGTELSDIVLHGTEVVLATFATIILEL